jgi:lipoyl(octanoyl) transferase
MAAGGIIESYRRISGALMHGLERLHLYTAAERKEGRMQHMGPVCFEVPSHYEITTSDGRKLVGSAQLRRKGGVLQHGTLPIHGDVTRICDVLAFDTPQKRDAAKMMVRRRAATLQDAIGEIIPWNTVVHALIAGFEEQFDMMFIQDALTPDEESDVERIEAEKYGNEAWTLRR